MSGLVIYAVAYVAIGAAFGGFVGVQGLWSLLGHIILWPVLCLVFFGALIRGLFS